ncbi:uncharacterized protein K02A2.6-like [Cydia strobilella]|uniref:uncharacterized protein K02A2.6-like n=1 Tax=Cydia strobilella TaxID=1100964 RepID=UPI0030043578
MTQQPSLTLEGLDLDGDRSSIGCKWERWKRSLYIYIDAADVKTDVKKRATLLHFGGTSLQDIFYNLPGAEVEAAAGVDVFDTAIKKLDEYFVPKTNRVFERHMFRLIKQEDKEKFESFLVRLRKQAEKCSFDKKDDHLIDQITEKCNSAELRKKILTIGDSITLEKIVTEANTLEVVNDQLEIYEEKKTGSLDNKKENQEVNAIYNRNKKDGAYGTKKDGAYGTKKEETQRKNNTNCGRCGKHHQTDYKECPALGKTCYGCGKMGHFRQHCRTSGTKRKLDNHSSKNIKGNKKARVEVDYVFNIDNDAIIECTLGGIKTKLLVDSGCKPNLITGETWESLKSLGAIATNQTPNPTRSLMAYGSHTPLNVKGAFDTTIEANGREEYATVYVIAGGTQDLLGRETATRLGVLKICVDVNKIDEDVMSQPFAKLKDVLVEIPIDKNVLPVSQPYRRIPLPIEKKVENKIQDLLARDIIEEVNGPSRWVSPMVPIMKENGDLRLCVDMRRANTAILRENHPLPCMDKLLPEIGKAKYFSKLDIKDAFHQLELHPDCRHITTFITAKGLYQYKRLMFGISCAPEIFQKVLEKLLVKCDGVLNFIDDILVFGDNEEQHDMRLAIKAC